jgi:hypothetical protein
MRKKYFEVLVPEEKLPEVWRICIRPEPYEPSPFMVPALVVPYPYYPPPSPEYYGEDLWLSEDRFLNVFDDHPTIQ